MGSVNVASDGAFIGTPKLYYPQVDMNCFNGVGMANDHLRPDLKENHTSVIKDSAILFIADGSSNEHQIINEIFNQKHAISTVKLLQLAHKRHVSARSSRTSSSYSNKGRDCLSNGRPWLFKS
tara:strand:- start:840 stop:1208 length:369 start_codon:yes stop_codon:yes gene_type:complete